ncbi:hypothetical protein NKH77_27690 [Streptomyces sp. M19]
MHHDHVLLPLLRTLRVMERDDLGPRGAGQGPHRSPPGGTGRQGAAVGGPQGAGADHPLTPVRAGQAGTGAGAGTEGLARGAAG